MLFRQSLRMALMALVFVSCTSESTGGTKTGPVDIEAGAPAAPKGLAAEAGNTQVSLTWKAVSGAGEYNVYRTTEPGGDLPTAVIVATSKTTDYVDPSLQNGTKYYYAVRAVKDDVESANSNIASATPFDDEAPPPGQVQGLVAVPGDGQVSLYWNSQTDATGFEVLSGTVSGGPYVVLASVTSANYLDTSVTNGATYYYVVRAMNAGRPGVSSVEASARPVPPLPGTPASVFATAGNAQIALAWSGGSRADSYTILASLISAGGPFTSVGVTTATHYTYASLVNGLTYYLRVRSENIAGSSSPSTTVTALPAPPLPAAPWAVTAAAGYQSVSLYWPAATEATTYAVYQATAPTGPYTLATITVFTTVTVTGLTNGTPYYFKIRAQNVTGYAESASAGATPKSTELCVAASNQGQIYTIETDVAGSRTPVRNFGRSMLSTKGVALAGSDMFVLDAQANTVSVFPRTATGAAAPTRVIRGQATGITAPQAITLSTARNELFVLTGDAILVFSLSAMNNTAPLRKITGDATQLCQAQALALDEAHAKITVFNYCSTYLTKYSITATGNAAPDANGTVMGVGSVKALAVDSVSGDTYVLGSAALKVYDSAFSELRTITGTANGTSLAIDSAQAEVYVGSATGGYWAVGTGATDLSGSSRAVTSAAGIAVNAIAVNSAAGEVVLAHQTDLETFAAAATGAAAPLRILADTNTGGMADPERIAVRGDELFVAELGGAYPVVNVYSRSLNGFQFTPLRQIGGPSSQLVSIYDIDVAADGTLYVLDATSVVVFDGLADGDQAPQRVITGGNTGLTGPLSLVVNPTSGELIVSTGMPAILTFAAGATGDAAPLRTLAGANTGMNFPFRLALSTAHSEIYAGDSNDGSIRTFALSANGDTAPLRVIDGAATLVEQVATLDYDDKTGTLVVYDYTGDRFLVFAYGANGDVAPLRQITDGTGHFNVNDAAICR